MSHFSQFVESLSRLYQYNKINKQYIDKLLADKKIDEKEYNYIFSHCDIR